MLPKINGLFRLTRDCEMAYAQSGTAVAKFGLAASEKYKDRETKLFIDAVAFGNTGEILQQFAGTKGTQIYLTGKIQLDQWQDKNTGEKRSKTTMIIEGFDFVSNGGGNSQQGGQSQQQQRPQQQNQQPPQYAPNDFDDNVPF